MINDTDVMRRISNEDLDWIRGTPISRSIRSAIPPVYEVYGLLDVEDDDGATELRLLSALGAASEDRLIAGWIERSGSMTEPGDVQVLYANWRYRCREVTRAELDNRSNEHNGDFPDLLFPHDRSWLVSTLWDDTWRSLGVSTTAALELQRQLPSFEGIGSRRTSLTLAARSADDVRKPVSARCFWD